MKKRKLALLLAAVTVLTMLSTACTGKKETAKELDIDLSSYPIETDITLTYFLPLRSSLGGLVENYAETPHAKEFVKRTGVNIEYIHASIGQESEMLSLLIASDELPDIMHGNWIGHQGGVESAIEDGIIVDIGEYKEYAPAFFGKLESNSELDRAAKTDAGHYYGFSSIQNAQRLRMTAGPVLRADWLSELGLQAPETIEEWETVLTAFKEKKGAVAPFSAANRPHMYSMFGIPNGLFIDGDEYKYGLAIPEVKKAVEHMNDWFNKGLLDVNITSVDAKTLDSQVLTGMTGAMIASGGDIERYMNASKEKGFELVGVRFPAYEKGSVNDCMSVGLPITGTSVSAISGQCKYPELAAKVLDYCYTEEGEIFANYGTEDVSYTMVDGAPTYTDVIMNNPDGLSIMESLSLYVKAGASGPFECKEGYINQYYSLPQQQASLDAWQVGFKESEKRKTRPITLTTDEAQEAADILAEVRTYASSMVSKFIVGIEPIDKFDEYLEEVYDLGLQRALDIYTDALKRYNAR